MDKKRFLRSLEPFGDRLDIGTIERAYAFGEEAHAGQKRLSGDPFMAHSAEIARILLDLNLIDTTTIVAALLHDVAEDTHVSVEQVGESFGREVASLVEGLTKLGTSASSRARSGRWRTIGSFCFPWRAISVSS